MIQLRNQRDGPVPPWHAAVPLAPPVFCALWSTGEDPAVDHVFRLLALRAEPDGSWRAFDRWADPNLDQDEPTASARMVREFGATRAEFEGAPAPGEVWPEFRAFVGDGPVVCLDADAFESWYEHFERRPGCAPPCLGLDALAALLTPGSPPGVELVPGSRSQKERRGARSRAVLPLDLRSATAELVARFHAGGEALLRVAAAGYGQALAGLVELDPRAAERLAVALGLADRPSAWARGADSLFDAAALEDGRLSAAFAALGAGAPLAEGLEPRVAQLARELEGIDPLPPRAEDPTPFPPEDQALLDDVFRVHLPALLRDELGVDPRDAYRPAQHRVATEVARALGAEELLLVHAPTGTGKTLAYLVPALVWARRHGLRVGVATYTRALQEQARDRELPRALSALARAGLPGGFRVAVLKGRENYVCWRALRSAGPDPLDGPETWLAWTRLALFALSDGDADLDRFPRRTPLRLDSPDAFDRQLAATLREVRARTGCCPFQEDRATCGAELARRRAERSHVVLTNQSFTLARQEFFKHLVFDECEHLHAQAHNAWSHRFRFRTVRALLERLGRENARSPIERVGALARPESSIAAAAETAADAVALARATLAGLESALGEFELWRAAQQDARNDREAYGLLREFLLLEEARPLVDAHRATGAALAELDACLAGLVEVLPKLPVRRPASLRRALDLARGDLADLGAALEAWLPVSEGRPAPRPETFYDVERDAGGETALAARVLLPNEYLGRQYYPGLASGVFLSATAWLNGGFEATLGYLGLDRVVDPDPSEARDPRPVRTFRAPEAFDYGRVLVGVPRDAPAVRDKDAYLRYVRHFLAWLGERTRGRILALFTNAEDVQRVGAELEGFFRARRVPLWYQGMARAGKEELGARFRSRVDSILLGVDTFWYGADFPGETLEYLVLARLPFGVPDPYHHAQCAALGEGEQRRRIYLPRALAKFRQGFGRLMRTANDRGCVFVLDGRLLDPRHRAFLRELPLASGLPGAGDEEGARFVRGDTDRVVHEALAHMGMLADVERRGLLQTFHDSFPHASRGARGTLRPAGRSDPEPQPVLELPPQEMPEIRDIPLEDLPY